MISSKVDGDCTASQDQCLDALSRASTMRFEPWGVVDRPAPDLPVERLRYGAPLDLASPRDTLPNFPYSLASGMCRGILGVSPWNDFCPRQNPMPLIRPFVFSESPTVGKFGRLSDICSENGSRQLVNGCPAHFLCPDCSDRVVVAGG